MMRIADNIPGRPHRWAEAIAAWAHGRLVQWRYDSPEATDADWQDCDYQSRGMPNWDHDLIVYRVAPEALQPGAALTLGVVIVDQARMDKALAGPRHQLPATVQTAEEIRAHLDQQAALGVAPSEPLRWEFTGPGGLKRFLTAKQFEAQTPGVQKWYRPICDKCGPSGVPGAPPKGGA